MSEMDEWISWIEDAISKRHIKHYEYEYFSNIHEIGVGGFGKVYRANWKSSDQYFVLKSLLNLNSAGVKELVNEVIIKYILVFVFFTYFRVFLIKIFLLYLFTLFLACSSM